MSGLREARAWLFLAAGLVLAVLTGVALYGVAQQTSGGKAETPVSTSTTQVLVAKTDIAARTVLSPDLLARKDFPTDLVPAGAITTDTAAVGQTTLTPIARGQAIVSGQLRSLPTMSAEHGGSIESVLNEHRVFPPREEFARAAHISSLEQYQALWERARDDATVRGIRHPQQYMWWLDVETGNSWDYSSGGRLRNTAVLEGMTNYFTAIRSRAETQVAKTTSVDLGYITSTYGIKR